MFDDRIIIKGNKDGLNAVINIDQFRNFDDMLELLQGKLSRGKKFYNGCTLKITADFRYINEREIRKLKNVLLNECFIENIVFEDKQEKVSKVFSGIYEGRTKFIKKTLRSGQIVNYSGNIIVIGDVNHGAEVYAGGNIIVLGSLRGHVHAGATGNERAIVAAYMLQPEILQISNVMTRSPEDAPKPKYPEVARVKGNIIIVEPYLPNKYI